METVIIGGGPAGSTAARLLALWGHSVTVLTKPESSHNNLAVSLPPSCRKLFARLGVLEASLVQSGDIQIIYVRYAYRILERVYG